MTFGKPKKRRHDVLRIIACKCLKRVLKCQTQIWLRHDFLHNAESGQSYWEGGKKIGQRPNLQKYSGDGLAF